MKHNKGYKLAGIALITITLVVSVIFYLNLVNVVGILRQTSELLGKNYNGSILIILLGIIVIFSLLSFFLFWRVSNIRFIINSAEEEFGEDLHFDTDEISKEELASQQIRKEEEEKQRINQQVNKVASNLPEPENLRLFAEKLLSNIAKDFEVVQGMVFVKSTKDDLYNIAGTYAFYSEREISSFKYGEGITGQVAKNKKFLNINNVPKNYITILSGLGNSSPKYLFIFPIIYLDQTVAVVELASFKEFDLRAERVFTELSDILGHKIGSYLDELMSKEIINTPVIETNTIAEPKIIEENNDEVFDENSYDDYLRNDVAPYEEEEEDFDENVNHYNEKEDY